MINEKVTYDDNMNNPEKFGSELSKIKKENNFQVPENYFDDLPQMIQEKVNQKEVRFSFESMFLYFLKPYRVIALGSILALVILGLFIITNQEQENLQMPYEISLEDLIQEYPEMIEYMDDEVLVEFAVAQMAQEDIYFIDFEFGFDSMLFQDDIIQHLSDEDISEIIFNL